VAAVLAFAAAVALLAASYKYEQRAQSAAELRVPAPRPALTSKVEIEDGSADQASETPEPAETMSPAVDPSADDEGPPPAHVPGAPNASASAGTSERGLELFDDRH
jgi:hypothetical protein